MNKNKRVLKNKSNSKNKFKVNKADVFKLQDNVKKSLANKKGVRVKNTPCGCSINYKGKTIKVLASKIQEPGTYSLGSDKHGLVSYMSTFDTCYEHTVNDVVKHRLTEVDRKNNNKKTRK